MYGDVSFVELGASQTDTEGSHAFFHKVFGWEVVSIANGAWFRGPRIRIGLHGNDVTPATHVFFKVASVEASVQVVKDAGGSVEGPITEVPAFGKLANCRDPSGIPFGLHELPN